MNTICVWSSSVDKMSCWYAIYTCGAQMSICIQGSAGPVLKLRSVAAVRYCRQCYMWLLSDMHLQLVMDLLSSRVMECSYGTPSANPQGAQVLVQADNKLPKSHSRKLL
ncbi:TPA: hypothetical protein ACH3X1_009037 [Trebouxia sp. C0004]